MMYSKVLRVEPTRESTRVLLEYYGKEPSPGQFVGLVFPGESEIPLGVTDYKEGELELYVDSERLVQYLRKMSRVIVEGPFGKPVEIRGNVMGIAVGRLYHDLLYPLRIAKRKGYQASLNCESCTDEFQRPSQEVRWDLILASVPLEFIKTLPRNTLVYVRWVKMNCMMGVCGVCNVKGFLPCVEGPFMEVEKVVDKG
ncbi:2-polyprenylphenol hydroxylase-like oxidoreductase [Metallosphaera yellowstonensis MK1]|jgi:NAD(P)H-flavin reductase|uniref:2-polyprenylphenol hydroxylase-like oxidoreductase n=2 Tax=Metallosphaera TaxID=41980 RepID=H2C9B2_9CREN|nr:2-polyprenylphenol hydroxylase-like oxidoreductase [Metallosphaera yellowstonensis MK1]